MSYTHNPYGQASDAYSKNSTAHSTNQRSLEGNALMKAAMKLEQIKIRIEKSENVKLEELDDALTFNRKLWTVFASETTNEENDLEDSLKNSIASLAVFVLSQTITIQGTPEPAKIETLININRQIASGLLRNSAEPKAPVIERPPESSAENSLKTEI